MPGLGQLVVTQKTLLQARIGSLDQAIVNTDNKDLELVLEFRKSEMNAVVGWLDRCLRDYAV